jgi:cell division protein FtsX
MRECGHQTRRHVAVVSYRYQSKSKTYEQFAEQYADDPALLDRVSPEELPASYQVVVNDQEAARDLMIRLGDMRGVDHATIIDP